MKIDIFVRNESRNINIQCPWNKLYSLILLYFNYINRLIHCARFNDILIRVNIDVYYFL